MRSEELNGVLLADIGNTHFHIYNGETVEHLSYADAIGKYVKESLVYISVKHQISDEIKQMHRWKNISDLIQIEGEYDTMGVDRKALCLSHENGVFVDAGSAVTVDVVENGIYMGGYIYPGLKAMLNAYAKISPILDVGLNQKISLNELPKTTKGQISYGIIASIKSLIDKHSNGKTLYFTGGDGKYLASYFPDVIYDETLVFQGMMKVLK